MICAGPQECRSRWDTVGIVCAGASLIALTDGACRAATEHCQSATVPSARAAEQRRAARWDLAFGRA